MDVPKSARDIDLLMILVRQGPFRFYRTLICLAVVVEDFGWLKAPMEEP